MILNQKELSLSFNHTTDTDASLLDMDYFRTYFSPPSSVKSDGEYNEKSKICRFYLNVFEEQEDGSYLRFEETQKEKCYSKKQIIGALEDAGFEILDIHGDWDGKDATDTDEKWYITARNIKN
jgi:hypothetical protein